MSEMPIDRSAEIQTGISSTETMDDQDAKTLETVQRWARAVTAADHRAIYESSGRDYNGWRERQDVPEAS